MHTIEAHAARLRVQHRKCISQFCSLCFFASRDSSILFLLSHSLRFIVAQLPAVDVNCDRMVSFQPIQLSTEHTSQRCSEKMKGTKTMRITHTMFYLHWLLPNSRAKYNASGIETVKKAQIHIRSLPRLVLQRKNRNRKRSVRLKIGMILDWSAKLKNSKGNRVTWTWVCVCVWVWVCVYETRSNPVCQRQLPFQQHLFFSLFAIVIVVVPRSTRALFVVWPIFSS